MIESHLHLTHRRFKQKIWFRWQIDLADELKLPLIIHIRQADKDAIRILRRKKKKLHGGVVHCFRSDVEAAGIYTGELGLCLGIGGSILAAPYLSGPLEQAVSEVPLEYLMLETDAPFVKPVKPEEITNHQWNKARNTSLILPDVARKIAEIKGISEEEVIAATTANVRRVFGL